MEPLTRRGVLIGSAALGLSAFLPRSARAAAAAGPRALLTLWLEGGPSQRDSWDPDRDGAIATRIPGLSIADLYPRVAEKIDRLSVIRSLVSPEGDHERATFAAKTGHRIEATVDHPSLGAFAAAAAGARSALPPQISLGPARFPARGGYLGAELDALRIDAPGQAVENLRPAVAGAERQTRRRAGLEIVSRAFAARSPGAAQNSRSTLDRAFALMEAPELVAFELEDEPAAIRAAYGDGVFGRGCLVARRLLERGASAVEVTLSGFDSHTHNREAQAEAARLLDPALAALLDDLEARDLLRSTVLLVTGEFGRTPKLNPLDGRDHWPHGFSALLGGAGLARGRVIGGTDPRGQSKQPSDPVSLGELSATILTALGVDPSEERFVGGRPIRPATAAPRRELLL